MYTKKSAVDLTDLAIGIVVLGVTVVIGASILLNVRDSQLTDLALNSASQNVTGSNTTATQLTNAWYNGLTSVVNQTNISQVVPASNYTITTNAATGKASILVNGATWNAKGMTVTYTHYDTTDERFSLPDSAATGLAEYGNWFNILVIVGIAAVILALIFMAFSNRGGGVEGSGQSY